MNISHTTLNETWTLKMSQVHTEHSKFFNGLDSLLENGPGGAGADLSPVLSKLEHFVQVGEVEQAENTLRDLATAVGGQSEYPTCRVVCIS